MIKKVSVSTLGFVIAVSSVSLAASDEVESLTAVKGDVCSVLEGPARALGSTCVKITIHQDMHIQDIAVNRGKCVGWVTSGHGVRSFGDFDKLVDQLKQQPNLQLELALPVVIKALGHQFSFAPFDAEFGDEIEIMPVCNTIELKINTDGRWRTFEWDE